MEFEVELLTTEGKTVEVLVEVFALFGLWVQGVFAVVELLALF